MLQWMKVYTQHIKVCLEQAKRRTVQGVNDIRQWLSTPIKTQSFTTPTTAPSRSKPLLPKGKNRLLYLGP